MFGQNAHAKLHKIAEGTASGPAQKSQYSATNNVFSPPTSNVNFNTVTN